MQSLAAAKQRVRDHLAAEPTGDVEVVLYEGVYRLTEPLVFGPADTAAEGHTVTWRAAEGAKPRVSGGRPIDGWKQQEDGSFLAVIDEVANGDWAFSELFVNGRRRPLARFPSRGFARVKEDRRTHFTFHADDVPAALDGDLSDTGLNLVFFHEWSSSRTPVASIDQIKRRLDTRHPVGPLVVDFFVMDHWDAFPRYFLENHPALLTSPGEWYLDHACGELTYLPLDGESPASIKAIAPLANGLIKVRGRPEAPVRGLIFRGLHFEHARWMVPNVGYHGMQADY